MEFSVSSTNNFIESARLSPRSVNDDHDYDNDNVVVVVVASASNAVSVQSKHNIPNNTLNPSPVPTCPTAPSNCNLRRKPSNEMIHARNLLKMFKETFQNDDELNEAAEQTQSPPGQFSQVFDFTKTPAVSAPTPAPPTPQQKISTAAPITTANTTTPIANPAPTDPIPHVHVQTTQIPRPLGKPPMSPKAQRVKPASSPQQFSINGRVEIFNSRQLEKPPTPPPRRAFKTEPEPLASTHHVPEVVMCAPPITIVSAEELPKPNTVKALSSCFGQATPLGSPIGSRSPSSQRSSTPIGMAIATPASSPAGGALPKALPRSRIPQITPPASPKPNRYAAEHTTVDVVDHALLDRSSGDYAPITGQTRAVIHTPPTAKGRAKEVSRDPLAPNDTLQVHVTTPSPMPELRVCTPNESSLFKLAGSAPTSPGAQQALELALCQQFLEREANRQQLQLAPEDRQRLEQQAVEEVLCDRIDVAQLPKLPSTGCQTVSDQQLATCDGIVREQTFELAAPKDEDVALCVNLLDCLAPAQEPSCDAIDVRQKPAPATGYQNISEADLRRCDRWLDTKDSNSNSNRSSNTGNKPSSTSYPSCPISNARAAHSKALSDTCEQIIAEERLASSQMMRSSLPEASGYRTPTGSTPGTPQVSRKSKIPIPKACCISASNTDSIGRTGYLPVEQPLIARTQVVETEINVKQMTPPSSPRAAKHAQENNKDKDHGNGNGKGKDKDKKNKTNIFDFLRRNFGHHEEPATPQPQPTLNETLEPKVVLTSTRSNMDVLNADGFLQVDNSKFYLANDEMRCTPPAAPPPPLPATPAPVNIEIRKTITTDEILEEHNTEQALSQEISDLLDDELNKLEAVATATTTATAVGAGH